MTTVEMASFFAPSSLTTIALAALLYGVLGVITLLAFRQVVQAVLALVHSHSISIAVQRTITAIQSFILLFLVLGITYYIFWATLVFPTLKF